MRRLVVSGRFSVSRPYGVAEPGVDYVVVAVVGIVSLKIVVWTLYRAQLKIFAFYVWLLAALILRGIIDGAPVPVH